MWKRFLKYANVILPVTLLAGAVALRIWDPSVIQQVRFAVFDGYQEIQPREFEVLDSIGGATSFEQLAQTFTSPADMRVKILDLDDASLERLGQWPWPRRLVAEMVERLAAMGAITVTFDIVFAEPDGKSPRRIVPNIQGDLPALRALQEDVTRLPDYDELLAQTFAKDEINVVTGFVPGGADMPREPVIKTSLAARGPDPKRFLPRFAGAVSNLTQLEEAAAGNGSFAVRPDSDGIIRRVPMFYGIMLPGRDEGESGTDHIEVAPSLSVESLRVAQQALGLNGSYAVRVAGEGGDAAFGADVGLTEAKVGQFRFPVDSQGNFWVHFTRGQPARYIPAWEIFEDSFDPLRVAGHIVLVGTSAAGLKDIRATPLNPVLPGVEVHAQVIEQIITGAFLQRPGYAVGAEVVFMAVLGVILIVMLPFVGAVWSGLVGLLAIGSAVGVSWYAYDTEKLLIDPVYPSIACFLVFLSSSLISYVRSESEKQEVRGAFSMYLSPDLVEQLADEPEKLTLGGEMRDMTVLFCDVRGFTTISEQFDAHGLTNFINRFLTPMTRVIMSRRGTIDKYMGDCIMAFWNAPLDDAEHAKNGCRSALTMLEERDELNAKLKQEAEDENRKFIPVNIGIGLNTGIICVGNMGSEQRFDYSVLGDDVNLASRLEGQSKTYGVDIVIGDNTAKQVDGFAVLELDLIKVKGKTEAVRIWACMGDEEDAASEDFQKLRVAHEALLKAYRAQGWDQAEQLIGMCRQLARDRHIQGYYDLIQERVTEFRQNPPPQPWDGVYVATSK